MNEQLKSKIDKKLSAYTTKIPLNRDFFYEFFDVLEENGYKNNFDEILDVVFQNLNEVVYRDSKEPLRFMVNYPICKQRGHELLEFFRERLSETDDKQSLIDEMFGFVKSQTSSQTSFNILFVKYLSLKYNDQITLDVHNADFSAKDEDLVIFAKLGNFGIGALEASYYDDVGVTMHEIRTYMGLTSQRIGLVLMQKLFQIVDEKYPEQQDLLVQNVINKNVGAQRFYERLGGQFYTPDGEPIRREDITADYPQKGRTNVFYDKEAIKDLASAKPVTTLNLQEFISRQKEREL